MNAETIPYHKTHHGRNVRRLREMLGIKQEALAFDLDMTQQNFSRVEQKEEIEDKLLQKIAGVMKVPVEAIKNMSDEMTYNYINHFSEAVTNHGTFTTNPYNCTFNPIEKIVELYDEKIALLERMIKLEQEKNAMLEKMATGKI